MVEVDIDTLLGCLSYRLHTCTLLCMYVRMFVCMYVYRTVLCMYKCNIYLFMYVCVCGTALYVLHVRNIYCVCMYVLCVSDCKNTNYSASVYLERLYVRTNIDSNINSSLQIFIHIRRVIIGACTARAALKSLILLPVVVFTCSVRFTARSKNAAT